MITQKVGDSLILKLDGKKHVGALRLCFDHDFERKTVSDNHKMRTFAMKLHTGQDFKPVRVASTLVRDFSVLVDGKEKVKVENNFHRLVTLPINTDASKIEIKWIATNGDELVKLFSVDLIP